MSMRRLWHWWIWLSKSSSSRLFRANESSDLCKQDTLSRESLLCIPHPSRSMRSMRFMIQLHSKPSKRKLSDLKLDNVEDDFLLTRRKGCLETMIT